MQPPLFGLDQTAKSIAVTAQRHLNLYAEIKAEGEKRRVVFYGTPGLTLFTTFGDTPIRGWIAVGDYIYAIHRGTFWQVDNAGVKTSRGTITTTSGRVRMSYNGTQIVIADGTSMYCYTIASTAFVTVSSSLFSNPLDVTYQDQYFIACFSNSGRFQISDPNSGTVWDALDFATAESNPDNLIRIVADHGELCLFGDLTVEFWGNSGGQDFPYSNQRGSTLPFGLAAADSLVKYNDSLAGLFQNEMGQVQVMMLRGHALTPISTEEIDATINSYATKSDATAFSYMLGGHPMFQINFPSAGKSWLYDGKTGLWSPLESGLSGGRHRGEMRINYLNIPRVADYENGNIYTIDPTVYTDNGTAIPRELISRKIYADGKRVILDELVMMMEAGVGLATGQGSDPQIMLQISKDGGKTYENEAWRSFGAIGDYNNQPRWNRCGSAKQEMVLKLRVTDPVKVVFAGESYRVRA